MAFDFPNAPINGQTLSGPNGVQYVYDGTKWTPAALPNLYAPINAPVFTGDARAVTAAVGDNDTSIATTAFVQTAAAPAQNNAGRNLVHNSVFAVTQRGAGPWSVSTNYTADRWRILFGSGDADTASIVAATDTIRSAIGDEACRWLYQHAFAGAAAAGNFVFFVQAVEAVTRLSNKTVTLSFWATASAALQLGVSIDQSFGTGGSPSAAVNGTGQHVNLTTGWARYSLTFAVPSTAGKSLGTNGDDCTPINFWLSSGSTNATRAGIGVQSGTIQLWGIQLEIGSVATPLEKLDPQQDLAKCQRFFCRDMAAHIIYNATGAGGYGSTSVSFPVTMRATPTVTVLADFVTPSNTATISADYINPWGMRVYVTANAAGITYCDRTYTASADL